ncbi:MAG: glycosyltransferase family 4 protein [Candidatus Neomarinimicrobiota bacterium]
MRSKFSLLIPGDFPPVVSGIATYFYQIWRLLPTENNYILCPRDNGYEQFDQDARLNTIRRQISSGDSTRDKLLKGLLYAFWTLILHRKYRFHKIHCGQVLSSGFAGWLMHKLFGVPYVIYVYGSETYRFGRNRLFIKCIKVFLMNAELIIPNSHFTRDEFLALGIPPEKFRIVTPGVDTTRFKPAIKDLSLMEKYDLTGKTVLLTVARLDERKGHDIVIQAVADLARQFPQIVYLIVGRGREEERLRKLSAELNISDRVIFCGYVADNDLPKFYNLSDIFILLNRQTSDDPRLRGDYEGFGIVFLEAAACGKPAIAGNFGGTASAVSDGQSGLIIDGTDQTVVRQTIVTLIENSSLTKQLGQFGLERARRYFDWRIISEEIARFL